MTPSGPDAPTPRLGEPAGESPDTSVDRERDAVGDRPDTGGLVPPDRSQGAHADGGGGPERDVDPGEQDGPLFTG